MKFKVPRPFILKLLAGCLGTFLLALLVFFLWIDSVADRHMEEFRTLVETLEAEAREREDERPILRGTPIPGRAWEDYGPALKKVRQIDEFTELIEFAERQPTADRDLVKKAVSAYAFVFDHLSRGARKTIGPAHLSWEIPGGSSISDLLGSSNVTNLVVCKARFLAEDGQTGPALDLLLDGLQFARDLGDNSILIDEAIGISHSRTLLEELRILIDAKAFDPEELDRLALALKTLDQNYPRHGDALRNETLYSGRLILDGPDLGDGEGWKLPAFFGWRYGFSERWILAEAFTARFRLLDRVVKAEGRSWTDLRHVWAEIKKEAEGHPNPILSQSLTLMDYSTGTLRTHRARLRLLRAAVEFRRSQSVPPFEDPFGETLLHALLPERVRIWSVGADGTDDGGNGGWEDGSDSDLVLEMER